MLESLNHNGRVWKWVSGLVSVLLVAAIIGLVRLVRKMERVETTQELMSKDVEKLEQQWSDWYNVLKVPERDQRQDSAIEELTRRLLILEGRR